MKQTRQLAITIYLLNRDIVTGKDLAERFEVSERTIQRDIEAINMAGIPIVSFKGIGGGYQVLDTFKLLKQPLKLEDIETILMALRGLETALDSSEVGNTVEKIRAILPKHSTEMISVDFSVIHEDSRISDYLRLISQAILDRKVIGFSYSNSNNFLTIREVEPVMLQYKWYAWYLVGYCLSKLDYRIFKLNRISNLQLKDKLSRIKHIASNDLFDNLMSNDNRAYIDIELQCYQKAEIAIKEYLPKAIITEYDNSCLCKFKVPENERMWYGILLSLGNKIRVLKPESLQKRIVDNAIELINLYKGN